MKSIGMTVLVVLALVAGTSAQQTSPAPPAASKTIEGKWDVTITTDTGAQAGRIIHAAFKQDGSKLSGTISAPEGDTALVGDFADGKIKFSVHPVADNPTFEIAFAGVLKDDGTLSGTFRGPDGVLNWTAVRSKG